MKIFLQSYHLYLTPPCLLCWYLPPRLELEFWCPAILPLCWYLHLEASAKRFLRLLSDFEFPAEKASIVVFLVLITSTVWFLNLFPRRFASRFWSKSFFSIKGYFYLDFLQDLVLSSLVEDPRLSFSADRAKASSFLTWSTLSSTGFYFNMLEWKRLLAWEVQLKKFISKENH